MISLFSVDHSQAWPTSCKKPRAGSWYLIYYFIGYMCFIIIATLWSSIDNDEVSGMQIYSYNLVMCVILSVCLSERKIPGPVKFEVTVQRGLHGHCRGISEGSCLLGFLPVSRKCLLRTWRSRFLGAPVCFLECPSGLLKCPKCSDSPLLK